MCRQQLVTLVERAQASKAPIQLVADRIAAIFVPAIVALSVLTFVVWYGVCCLGLVPKEWVGHDGTLMFCFLFANAVVVVACPCGALFERLCVSVVSLRAAGAQGSESLGVTTQI